MAIFNTYNSNREGNITYLNTYPTNGNSLNLKASSTEVGANDRDLTGQYWRPVDGSSNTPTYSSGNSQAELGFVVKFADTVASAQAPESYRGKVMVTVSLYLSEKAHWLYVTNKVTSPSSTATILGYNYNFKINGTAYSPNATINEVANNDLNKPDFTQPINGVSKNFTFRTNNVTSSRTYIRDHSTRLWTASLYVTPVNGKASVTIDVINLYLHWTNIYNGMRPTIWTGSCRKTFTSTQTYTPQSFSLTPTSTNITLYPRTATQTTIKSGSTITTRTFDNNNVSDTVIVDSINTNITSYKDNTSSHKISISNIWPTGTVISNALWSSSNTSAIALSSTTSTSSTNAIFNGTISNCNVSCNVSNIIRNSSITFATNNAKSFSCSNPNIARINSTTGQIQLIHGTNGTFDTITTFSGGTNTRITFNSYLVPNGIDMGIYAYGTNTPITTLNRGEKASIRAGVLPFSVNNSYVSTYSGYRPLTITKQGSGIISNSSAITPIPYYEATYTAPTIYGDTETIVFTATQPNTMITNSISLTLNASDAIPLPNIVISLKSIEPSLVTSGNYCLLTYELSVASGERSLLPSEQQYIDNISLTFNAEGIYGDIIGSHIDPETQETVYEYSSETYARVASNLEDTGLTITNPKRQCIFYVEGSCATGYEVPSLSWKSLVNCIIPDPNFPNNTQTLSDISINSVYLNYINIRPANVIMFVDDVITINFTFNRNQDTTDINITYPSSIVQILNSSITYSSDRLSGSGYIRIKSIHIGKTSLVISSEGMTQTCDIYVVERNLTSKILYPYVYNKNGNLYYNSIRNDNKEALRVIFKMPSSEIYNLMDDIHISIIYEDNNTEQSVTYSLKTSPELFSLIYPKTNNLASDLAFISQILSAYENQYTDNPYCIFQEPGDIIRDTELQILKFRIEYIFKSAYSETVPFGIVSEITTDNIYNLEPINVNDNLIGYDSSSSTPYSLLGYMEAYKSYTKGYTTNLSSFINDYGREICSLTDLGKKGEYITVVPFYQFLLANNYIRAIDRYLMKRYYDIAAQLKSVSSDNIPNSFYPQEIRNMYITESLIAKYGLRNTQDKNLVLPYEPNVTIYDVPTKFPANAAVDYPIMADDSSLYYYNDVTRPNLYLNDTNYNNYTISPLWEFKRTFYQKQLNVTSTYLL